MADDPSLLDRLLAEEPPSVTAWLPVFPNSPEPAPWVVRLLGGDEDGALRKHIGALRSDEEKAAAWLREPFVFGALVSIDGVPVTGDEAYRRRLVNALGKARIAALFLAYRDLDRQEMETVGLVTDAPFLPGADFGPPSRASGTAPGAASPSSLSPATTAAPSPA